MTGRRLIKQECLADVGDRYDSQVVFLANDKHMVISNPAGYEHDGPE